MSEVRRGRLGRREGLVTLTTQGDLSYLEALVNQSRRWDGPLASKSPTPFVSM